MNKKRLFYTTLAAVIIIGIGVFYVHTQRQKNFAKTREVFAPIYAYSGKLTPEQQKKYSELTNSLMNVSPDAAQKYRLPQREHLMLEAHTMTLYRDNPELLLMGHRAFPADTDIGPYQRHFGILALIAKTKLADLPADSRKVMVMQLESLNIRLVKNSVGAYIDKIRETSSNSSKPRPNITFGVVAYSRRGETQPIFQEDGSMKMPEERKRGVAHITDIYGKEYTVDLDSLAATAVTEDTSELYAKIDRLFEELTDQEFQRLSTLSKTERTEAIETLFSSL